MSAVKPDPDELGIRVDGCGAACDCCAYMRAACAWGRWVGKLGDKYLIYDRDNKVIGEADPGFEPLPEDLDWAEKVEFSMRNGQPDPDRWPKARHELWAWARGHDLQAPTERHIVIVKVIRTRIAKAQKRPEPSVTNRDIYASARRFGMSYVETVAAVQEIEAMGRVSSAADGKGDGGAR